LFFSLTAYDCKAVNVLIYMSLQMSPYGFFDKGVEKSVLLETGDIFFASIGTEHVAHPQGEARILVVESEGSV